MNKWCIFYADGSTYSDQDGTVESAPAWGVLAIVEITESSGPRMITGGDYFVWDDRGMGYHWWDANELGLIDYVSRPGWKKVVIGRLVDTERYNDIRAQAYRYYEARANE